MKSFKDLFRENWQYCVFEKLLTLLRDAFGNSKWVSSKSSPLGGSLNLFGQSCLFFCTRIIDYFLWLVTKEGGGGIDNIFAKPATFVIEDKLLSLLGNWQFANQKHFSFLIRKIRFADDVSSVLLHQLFRLTKFLVMQCIFHF